MGLELTLFGFPEERIVTAMPGVYEHYICRLSPNIVGLVTLELTYKVYAYIVEPDTKTQKAIYEGRRTDDDAMATDSALAAAAFLHHLAHKYGAHSYERNNPPTD